MEKSKREIPSPILDGKETRSLEELTARYEKMTSPGFLQKAAAKVVEIVPEPVKAAGETAAKALDEQELFKQAMAVVADGFKVVQEQAAKYTISEKSVVRRVNKASSGLNAECIEDFAYARGYELAKAVNAMRAENLGAAAVEGGAMGAVGFPGIPFSLVLSTFLYFRAVQSVAIHYGYDIKNDAAELVIAGSVFASAMSPKAQGSTDELAAVMGKIMFITEAEVVKQAAKKGWGQMISQGGASLLIAQMRALSHKAAANALQAAGAQGLEQTVFKKVFEQIGRRLSLEVVKKSVPVVSGVIGALFDTAQMSMVLDYADVFYHKRFLLEKETRLLEVASRDETSDNVEKASSGSRVANEANPG